MTSSRSNSALVAEWRRRSISSFDGRIFLYRYRSRQYRPRAGNNLVRNENSTALCGKKLAQLGTKLRCKTLIVCKHQGRALGALDDVCHGEGLTRTGNAEQRLLGQTVFHTGGQGCNRPRADCPPSGTG